MQKEILAVIRYFNFFSYPPTLEEIHTFLPVKISKKDMKKELERLAILKYVSCFMFHVERYTLVEYSIKQIQNSKVKSQKFHTIFKDYRKRQEISENKIQKIKTYVKILGWFPQIKLVGISGSVAMMNAKEKDDIDLFIITSKNRLWTGRLIALSLAQLLGLRRKRGEKKAKDKVCLNLFFDEKGMEIADRKKTLYVGHEIMQVKMLINKYQTYERFLKANRWVNELFPNVQYMSLRGTNAMSDEAISVFLRMRLPRRFAGSNLASLLAMTSNYCECILKKLQLHLINKHKTKEIITDTQLWFFPRDFEEKMKRFAKR